MPDREAVLGVVGLSLPEAMAALAPHLPEADTLRLAEHYRDRFVAAARGRRRRGARAALSGRARGARPAGGATRRRSSASPPARRGAGSTTSSPAHGLGRLFATAQTADDHPSKPIPRCCSPRSPRPASRPARAVMVGDTEFDIAMGRAAGMATIGVAWGYHPARAAARRPAPTPSSTASTTLDAALARLGPRRELDPAASASGSAPPVGPRPRASASASTTAPLRDAGRRAARRARPRRSPRRSPPNGTRSRARSAPERLPLTRAANSAIDRVAAAARGRWSTRSPPTAAATSSATAPPRPTALAARQAAGWDPWLRLGGARARRAAGGGDRRHARAAARREPRRPARRRRRARRLRASWRSTNSSPSRARSSSASRSPVARSTRRDGLGALADRRDLAGRAVGRRRRGRSGRRRPPRRLPARARRLLDLLAVEAVAAATDC